MKINMKNNNYVINKLNTNTQLKIFNSIFNKPKRTK